MQLAIRTDANELIGAGHLMRCLELANTLAKKNIEIRFIVKESALAKSLLKSQLVSYLKVSTANNGLEETNQILKQYNIKSILIDHYEIDIKWEEKVVADNVIIIDDLADRAHLCDLLIDTSSESRLNAYKKLVPKHSKLLLGPQFAIIRDEFLISQQTNENSYSIFICFGASDPNNYSLHSLIYLNSVEYKGVICLITGQGYYYKEELKMFLEQTELTISWHHAPTDLAKLMQLSKVIITAPGTMLLEAAVMGKPIIMIKTANNQDGNISLFQYKDSAILATIPKLAQSIALVEKMKDKLTSNAKKICDGKGKYKIANFIHTTLENNI